MPTYYFHLRNGDHFDRDPEGTEFASLDAAIEEALQAARELVALRLLKDETIDGQIFEITNEQGEVLDKVPLRSVVRFK